MFIQKLILFLSQESEFTAPIMEPEGRSLGDEEPEVSSTTENQGDSVKNTR